MSNDTTQHTPADVRERVVDEIMSTFRTLYPHAGGSVAPAAYAAADRIIALLRIPRGEGCRMVDETYCATHDCGAHDDDKCGRPGCQHCDVQTVGDRHRLSRHLLALASVIEGGGKPSNSVADDVRRAASALVYTPPPLAMRQVTGRLASLLGDDADWLHDEALAGRLPDRCQAVAERIRAALRSDTAETPRGEGERGLIMRAMLETFPWSPDIRQEHFERAADAVIAALRSEAPVEGEVRERVAPGWSEVRERANMLRAVLREHGFEHLRSALVGQHSDAVFYGQWERHKALLRDLLDALDAALRSEAQGEEDAVRRTWEQAVQRAYGCLDYCGGYHGAELKAFHSGIKTVIRALEAGLDTVDTQTAALDRIGAARRGEGGE